MSVEPGSEAFPSLQPSQMAALLMSRRNIRRDRVEGRPVSKEQPSDWNLELQAVGIKTDEPGTFVAPPQGTGIILE